MISFIIRCCSGRNNSSSLSRLAGPFHQGQAAVAKRTQILDGRLALSFTTKSGNPFWSTNGGSKSDHESHLQQPPQQQQTPLSSSAVQSNSVHWSEEWKQLGLGAQLVNEPHFPAHLFFVQLGFGVDQHGTDDATKAAIRAVRNAIEFNSIPGVISHLPGGRAEMLIHVKLGVPNRLDDHDDTQRLFPVDPLQVAKVFPYGKVLPLQIVPGGLSFHTGRVVEELGDTNDVGICVAACVSLGYGHPQDDGSNADTSHTVYNTKDGY